MNWIPRTARILSLSYLCLFSPFGLALHAQDSKVDLFAGLSYVNSKINGLSSRQHANGWDASITGNFLKYLSAEGNISGSYYKTRAQLNLLFPTASVVNIGVTDYSFLGGPRINVRPVFVHALFGINRMSSTARELGFSASQNSLSVALGAGVQWKISPAWSIRISTDYWVTRQNLFGGSRINQNNYRASVGIVFNARKVRGSPPVRRSPVPSPRPLDVAASLGVRGYPSDRGFNVTEVTSPSAASRAGITSEDTIVTIDGQLVHTADEIEAVITNSPNGTVKIVYVVKGIWTLQREVNLH